MTSDRKKLWEPPTLEAIDMRDTAQKTARDEANNCGPSNQTTMNCQNVS